MCRQQHLRRRLNELDDLQKQKHSNIEHPVLETRSNFRSSLAVVVKLIWTGWLSKAWLKRVKESAPQAGSRDPCAINLVGSCLAEW